MQESEARQALDVANEIPDLHRRVLEYEQLGQSFPELAPLWFNLAGDLLREGRPREARVAALRALGLSPSLRRALSPPLLEIVDGVAAPSVSSPISVDPIAARVGCRAGDFAVLGIASRSALQVLYDAERLSDQHPVTLRALPHLAPLPAEHQLERELLARGSPGCAAALAHVLDGNGVPLLALERVHGTTLADRTPPPPWPLDELLVVARALAAVLEPLHRELRVHGELRPELVVWAPATREVTLLGVGAGDAPQPPSSAAEREWASMERCAARPLDARADVHGLGRLLYWMATGASPPTRETLTTPLVSAARTELSPGSPEAARFAALDPIVARCLAPLPEDRYPTIAALRWALDAALPTPLDLTAQPTLIAATGAAVAPVVAAPTGIIHTETARPASQVPDPRRWLPLRLAAAVALGLVISLLLALLLSR